MSEPLFYCPELPAPGEIASLAAEEAHHAAASRRLRVGTMIQLFDGRGNVARARVTAITDRRRALQAQINERRAEPRPPTQIHLASALPKSDRQAVLLDMATQLGMCSFTPLDCEHNVVRPGPRAASRWRRICLEACKQSRRLYLPDIHSPATPAQTAAHATAAGHAVVLAHPAGTDSGAPFGPAAESVTAVTVLVGPEGGFTEKEVREVCAHGALTVGLGAAILRIETAAVALLARLAIAGRR